MAHTYKNSKVDLTSTNATALITVASGSTVIVKSIIIDSMLTYYKYLLKCQISYNLKNINK